MFGYSEEELSIKSGYDLVHPNDLLYFSAAHLECKLWNARSNFYLVYT